MNKNTNTTIARLRAEVDMLRQAMCLSEDMARDDWEGHGGWAWEAMKDRDAYEEALSRLRELEKS